MEARDLDREGLIDRAAGIAVHFLLVCIAIQEVAHVFIRE